MSPHQAFPEPAEVGGAAVREFRHDHHIPALWIEAEQIGAALQMAIGGAAGSHVLDQSDDEPGRGDVQLAGPMTHPQREGLLVGSLEVETQRSSQLLSLLQHGEQVIHQRRHLLPGVACGDDRVGDALAQLALGGFAG